MLHKIQVEPRRFRDYRGIIEESLFDEIAELAERLKGKRLLQVSSTATGGGVAELLRSTSPLFNDLGLRAEWHVVNGTPPFFQATKKLHNALQGGPDNLTPSEWKLYEKTNQALAARIDAGQWDGIMVHDPQPAALRRFMANGRDPAWVWRCHIDVSRPNEITRARFVNYIAPFDASVFTLQQYVMDGHIPRHVAIPPGIDPLSPKNSPLSLREAVRRVARFGIRPDRPLVTQVSRFDAWKNPLGALAAWRLARRRIPGLQLALVGESADDDPEGKGVLEQVLEAAEGLDNVFVISDEADDRAVNAFQGQSDVVLQLSIREGFGLTVSEALWAGTPVIGGEAGGIPLQIEHGRTGYLVRSAEEAVPNLVALVRRPAHATRMGKAGHESVKRRFLLPRLIRDELRLWVSLLDPEKPKGRARARKASGRGRSAPTRPP